MTIGGSTLICRSRSSPTPSPAPHVTRNTTRNPRGPRHRRVHRRTGRALTRQFVGVPAGCLPCMPLPPQKVSRASVAMAVSTSRGTARPGKPGSGMVVVSAGTMQMGGRPPRGGNACSTDQPPSRDYATDDRDAPDPTAGDRPPRPAPPPEARPRSSPRCTAADQSPGAGRRRPSPATTHWAAE
jgi:hypothetical protein